MKKLKTIGLIGIFILGQQAYSQNVKSWFPSGTTAVTNGSIQNVTIPNGFGYIGVDNNNQNVSIANLGTGSSVTITCDCKSGTGCSPFSSPLGAGCLMETGCSSCTKSQSVANTDISTGGLYNASLGIAFNTASTGPMAFEYLFNLPNVNNDLTAFFNSQNIPLNNPNLINNNGVLAAPSGYKIAKISIYGRVGIVAIPMSAMGGGEAATASCSCTEGSCIYDSKWTPIGTVYFCKSSGCTGSCTLTTSVLQANGSYIVDFTGENYKY